MPNKIKTDFEKLLERPGRRESFARQYAEINLEDQILELLEKKKWSFAQFAKAMNTSKSNVSRDLSSGGINTATVSRLSKMAAVLGVIFLPLFVQEEVADCIVQKLNEPDRTTKDWSDVNVISRPEFQVIEFESKSSRGQLAMTDTLAYKYSGMPNEPLKKGVALG